MKVPDVIRLWLNLLFFTAQILAMASATIWKPESVVRVVHRVVPIAHPVLVHKHVKVPQYYPVYKQVHVPYPVKVPYWIPVTKHVPKPLPIAKVISLPKVRIVKKPFSFPVPAPYVTHKAVPIYKPVPYKRTLYVPKPVKVPQYYPVHVHKVVHVPKLYHVPVTIPIFKPILVKRIVHVPYPVYIKKKRRHRYGGDHYSYDNHKHHGYAYSFGHSKHRPQYVAKVVPKVVKSALVDQQQKQTGDHSQQNAHTQSQSQAHQVKPWHTFGKPTRRTRVDPEGQTNSREKHQPTQSIDDDLDQDEDRPLRQHQQHRDSEQMHSSLPSSRPISSDAAQTPAAPTRPTLTLASPPPPPPLPPSSTEVHRRPELSHHRPQYAAHSMPHPSAENAPASVLLRAASTSLKDTSTASTDPDEDHSQSIQSSIPQSKRLQTEPSEMAFPQSAHVPPVHARPTSETLSDEHIPTWPGSQFSLHPISSLDSFSYASHGDDTPVQKKTIWESMWNRLQSLG